jgi:hypothetical protein
MVEAVVMSILYSASIACALACVLHDDSSGPTPKH